MKRHVIQRRSFLTLLGTAAAWPIAARAQQTRPRRVGIFMPYLPTDPVWQARVGALKQELQRLGWTPGGNIEFDERWTTDNMDLVRANAANLVQLKPDVIVPVGGRVIPILMQLTRTIPIVLPGTTDAVGTGYVDSLARPGANVTGFGTMEFSVFGKLLDILKQIAPKTSRVVTIFNPDNRASESFQKQIESFAVPLGIESIAAPIHSLADIERAIEMLAGQTNGGLIFPPDVTIGALRDQVIAAVVRHRVPAIYADRMFVAAGGLVSYDSDRLEIFRRTASYVDRVLSGEKPADLPFQEPIKYQLTVNLTTAKALDLTIPLPLLASADEVIE